MEPVIYNVALTDDEAANWRALGAALRLGIHRNELRHLIEAHEAMWDRVRPYASRFSDLPDKEKQRMLSLFPILDQEQSACNEVEDHDV